MLDVRCPHLLIDVTKGLERIGRAFLGASGINGHKRLSGMAGCSHDP